MEIEGWEPQAATPPDWWFEGGVTVKVEVPKAKRAGKKKDLQPSLFESSKVRADWVSALMASSVLDAQMATFAGRLKRDQVEQSVRVVADRNLVVLKSVFGQRLEMSSLRVDGLIASLQRILNVEGYPVLSVDSSQTIRLNLQLLKEQFELGDSDGR
jgi:hypothetical protein